MVCFGHSDGLVLQVHDLIASGQRRVDIALLQPVPDTRFLDAVHDALETLARRRWPVRLIVGQNPPDNVDVPALYKALMSGLDPIPNARLTVAVAAFRSCVVFEDCDSYSWNHAKIVTVDGVDALVGGHNMWSQDYLIDAPVSDLSRSHPMGDAEGLAAGAGGHIKHVSAGFHADHAEHGRRRIPQTAPDQRCTVASILL